MQCGICERETARLSCASCSRSRAWPIRYDTLLRITERDAAGEKVQEYLESTRGEIDNITVQNGEARERIRKLKEETAKLREKAVADTARLQAIKKKNAERRQLLEDAMKARERMEQIAASCQRDIKRLNQKWKALYTRTAEARGFLCREAAMLYGLRQKRKKSGKTEHTIGGVAIPNFLQDLNGHHYTQITTSLGHLSHLLVLISHYLGLKLPNEIILPSRDAPFTLIRGVLNNRHMATRPLHLEFSLSQLSRENPSAHTKFIEGISMLAINIAWLCFSQGLDVSEIDDACKPGWNMWRLLAPKDSTAAVGPMFGRTSHATANGNLATATGQAIMWKFKLGYNVVVEKIRYTLQGETIGQEWDLVPEAEREEKPVKLISRSPDGTDSEGGRSAGNGQEKKGDKEGVGVMVSRKASTISVASAGRSGWSHLQAAGAGISGWTRIKARTKGVREQEPDGP